MTQATATVIKDVDWSNAKRWVPEELFEDRKYEVGNSKANTITMHAGDMEVLRITDKGFYVRGVEVPQDEREAKAVYDAFREWMAWAVLTRK